MSSLGSLYFLALLEIIVILLVLLGISLWRLRKAQTGKSRIQFIESDDKHPTPSLYLDSEAAKTRSFAESLLAHPATEPRDLALRTVLGLRAGLLSKESELAKTPISERGHEEWTILAQCLLKVLDQEGYAGEVAKDAPKIYGEETPPSDAVITQQAVTIQHLREYVDQLLGKLGHLPLPDTGIQQRFDELDHINKELSMCLAVLEDENGFLRDQIAALLKLDQDVDAV